MGGSEMAIRHLATTGGFSLRRMAVVVIVVLQACLAASPALAVVLPEKMASKLQQGFSEYVQAEGFTEVDVTSMTGESWYTPARFPQMGTSALRPDADMDPVTKSVLLLESREAALPHTRYRITYRLEPAAPDYGDVRHAYIEVTRFNLGPTIHKDVVSAYGEHAAPPEVFGIGPHVSWRFVTGSIMGMRANVIRASRRVVSEAEARTADCLGVRCLSRSVPDGPAGEWQALSPPEFEPAVYGDADGGLPGPARVADYLFSYVTRNGEEPAFGAHADAPQMIFVISMNVVGQEQTASGTLHQPRLMDDAISDIWTQRRQGGADLVEWRRLSVPRPGRQ